MSIAYRVRAEELEGGGGPHRRGDPVAHRRRQPCGEPRCSIVLAAGANRHDSPLLEPTLAGLDKLDRLPEHPTVHLDRGYDSRATRALLDALGFDGAIARKGIPAPVQAGARWCDIQRFIDPHGLSVKIMQTYANFTVGGALSVNCHGRYVGLGPLVLSVRAIRVVLK